MEFVCLSSAFGKMFVLEVTRLSLFHSVEWTQINFPPCNLVKVIH
jgi:hypothetical protein